MKYGLNQVTNFEFKVLRYSLIYLLLLQSNSYFLSFSYETSI